MKSAVVRTTINYVAFQLGWFACVLGAANDYPIAGPLIVLIATAWHLSIAIRPSVEVLLLMTCALIGTVFDSALLATGWISFSNGMWLENISPYWMISLWIIFGTTLNVSMAWLKGRLLLAVVFGAAGGPISYLAGAKLGAMTIHQPASAIIVLAIGWGLVTPLLAVIAKRLDGFKSRSVHSEVLFGHLNQGRARS